MPSRAARKKRICVHDGESNSRSVVSHSSQPLELYSPWNSPGQNTGVSSLSLLQGIFPTQGSNPGLLHCRQVLYQLNYEGSPIRKYQFNSVQSLSRVLLFVTSWIAARQASLSITNSRSSLRLTPIESMMPSSHLLLLPPIPPSISLF